VRDKGAASAPEAVHKHMRLALCKPRRLLKPSWCRPRLPTDGNRHIHGTIFRRVRLAPRSSVGRRSARCLQCSFNPYRRQYWIVTLLYHNNSL